MTIDVFQHELPSVNCFFFLSLHSAFCDPRVMTTNDERNFDLQTRFSFEISLTQTKCWKFRLKFRSHLRNFVWNFAPTNEISNEFCHLQRICQVKFRTSARNFVNGETIEASEISPKIRSPRNFADLRKISWNFVEIRRNSLSLLLHSTVHNERKGRTFTVVVSLIILPNRHLQPHVAQHQVHPTKFQQAIGGSFQWQLAAISHKFGPESMPQSLLQ